ncbi:hypothetical protein EC900039_2652B, partial [Escherichia coli 90.0039]
IRAPVLNQVHYKQG